MNDRGRKRGKSQVRVVGRRPGLRPSVEGLEGRALMSYGGGLDFSFGSRGQVPYVLPATDTDSSFQAAASAVQADGKVVVTGSLNVINDPATGVGTTYFAAARYNADGTLDASFGSGGYFTSPTLSGPSSSTNPTPLISAEGVALQPDGKIVLVGDVTLTATGSAYAVRLNTDGTPDASFGTGGIVALANQVVGAPQLNFASSVAILPGGQVGVAGLVHPSTNFDLAVEVLAANGTLDASFGIGGQVLVPLPSGTFEFGIAGEPVTATASGGLVAQPDGKLVIASPADLSGINQSDENEIVATRFNADGTLDAAFGTGGQAVITPQSLVGTGSSAVATSLALQADGKLVIGGSSTYFDSPTSSRTQMLAFRLTSEGMPDATFGYGGANILTGLTPDNSVSGAVAIQPDGKIVLADRNFPDFFRLDANGFPDTTFGTIGSSTIPLQEGPPPGGLVGVSVLADGKLLAAGGNLAGHNRIGLMRLLGEGAVNDFGETGVSDPSVLITDQSIFAAEFPGGNTGAGEVVQFGTAGAGNTLPTPGAYDGGGIDELAVYLPQFGAFAIRPYDGAPFATGSDRIIGFGIPGAGNSIPAPGDYDGSGRTELGVYLPSLGAFAYRPANGGPDKFVFMGAPGPGNSIPAPADYFGTGVTDFAVYVPSQGAFLIEDPQDGRREVITIGPPGAGQSLPVPGDYEGFGFAQAAVYVPSEGGVVYRSYLGGPDVFLKLGGVEPIGALPAPGDYDRSGKDEAAAYIPSVGTLTYLPAGGGPAVSLQFGSPGTSIPFTLASDTDAVPGPGPGFATASVPSAVLIPLTPDMLDPLPGSVAKKAARMA